MSEKILPVFNLEFPAHCNSYSVFGYTFDRVDDYSDAVKQLARRVSKSHEFDLHATTGKNTITSLVTMPEREQRAVLPWKEKKTALSDIELLLCILTHREVFVLPPEFLGRNDYTLLADPREYPFGWTVRTSIPYEASTGEPDESYNIGFIKGINAMYKLLRSREWQKKYERGYVLFLAKQAFVHQIIEKAFLQSFTIWEHLYRVHNPEHLIVRKNLHKTKADKAIGYLLKDYGFWNDDTHVTRQTLQKYIISTRNEVAHYGRFPSKLAERDAKIFTEVTARLVAKVLGLQPKDVLCSQRRLENIFAR